MKRLLVTLTLLVSCCCLLEAQLAIGEWRAHYAYHNATACTSLGGNIYVLSDGSLYSYNPDDEYIDIYNKCTLLTDQGIAFMERCEAENVLMLVYKNANIDFLYPDESIVNLSDWHDKSSYDPTVNDVSISGSQAYLASNFGVVVVNLRKKEFTNTYPAGKNIISAVTDGKVILAATPDGVRMGRLTDNLLDAANWHTLCTNYFNRLVCFNGQFVALSHTYGLYSVNLDGSVKRFFDGKLSHLSVKDGKLIAGNENDLYVFDSLLAAPTRLSFDTPVSDAFLQGNTWWTACGTQGLRGYANGSQPQLTTASILPESPMRNYCDYITFTPDNRLLLAGGCLDYFGTTSYPGTVSIFDNESWTSFQEEGITDVTGLRKYSNVTSIVQDPTDPSHHFVSAYGEGIYEFRDGRFVANLNCTNSTLETAIEGNANYTRISRLQYDADGNLWITNSHAHSPLKVMTKSDGKLIDLYYDELCEQPTVTDILFHSSGLKWVIVMRAEAGLFCIDDAGTPFNTADDRTRFISPRFTDQDGNSTVIDYVYDIAEDKDGSIWVLTNQGPYVIRQPEHFFDPDFTFTKVKVPRNDGTNFVDYLLDAVYTTCIAIDAVGRKWIGTQSNGIYLISADGYETIHHFMASNSPLPSDVIKDIAINGTTGEVFIATDAGLVSFRSDATTPADEYVKSAVYAFPNPVEPDYEGVITINGLKADSDVRIIATDGTPMDAGTSLGGSYSWSPINPATGRRVATGVYHVLATDAEGRSGIATHIVVVR